MYLSPLQYLNDTSILSKADALLSDNVAVSVGQPTAPSLHSDESCAYQSHWVPGHCTEDGKGYGLPPSDFACIEMNTRSSVPDTSTGYDHSLTLISRILKTTTRTTNILSRLSLNKDVHVPNHGQVSVIFCVEACTYSSLLMRGFSGSDDLLSHMSDVL